MNLSSVKSGFLKFFSINGDHPSGVLAKRTALFFASFGFLGFITALYLTVEHYRGLPVNCIVLSGCDKVLSSSYSEVFGVPVALFGVIYYFFIFSTSLFFLFGHSKRFLTAALLVTPVGFLASVWFVILQLFIIKSICFYCMVSAFLSTSLFLSSCFIFFKFKEQNQE
ncbi:MAG: vitamin K epoxide reductase family protein [Candidatus Liptonbacteria bacterium]|nr:vitamin K epoxide reductase family protein [Candidatus Liptonbacteria bacterium]